MNKEPTPSALREKKSLGNETPPTSTIEPREETDKPLRVYVKDGKLTIEIGVATLAFADLERRNEERYQDPKLAEYHITDANGFALDVKRELDREEEDGSTRLTDVLDAAMDAAIENGSIHVRATLRNEVRREGAKASSVSSSGNSLASGTSSKKD